MGFEDFRKILTDYVTADSEEKKRVAVDRLKKMSFTLFG